MSEVRPHYRTGSTYALAWPATADAMGDQPVMGNTCLRSCSPLSGPLYQVARRKPAWRDHAIAPLRMVYTWQELGQRSIIGGNEKRFAIGGPFQCREGKDAPRMPQAQRFAAPTAGQVRQARSRSRGTAQRDFARVVSYALPPNEPEYVQIGGRLVGVRPPASGSFARPGRQVPTVRVAQRAAPAGPPRSVGRAPRLPVGLIPADQVLPARGTMIRAHDPVRLDQLMAVRR